MLKLKGWRKVFKKPEQSADQIQTANERVVLNKEKHLKSKHKVWSTPIFRRPKTFAFKMNPKYLRHNSQKAGTIKNTA